MMRTVLSEQKAGHLLSEKLVIQVKPLAALPTEKCFESPGWKPHIYNLRDTFGLPAIQPETDSCAISMLAVEKPSAFVDWIASLLFTSPEVDMAFMIGEIYRRKCLMTLPQGQLIAGLIEKGLAGPASSWCKKKIFFLVETGDPQRPVKMGCMCRDEGSVESNPWDFFADGLGRSTEWPPETQFLIPNLKRQS